MPVSSLKTPSTGTHQSLPNQALDRRRTGYVLTYPPFCPPPPLSPSFSVQDFFPIRTLGYAAPSRSATFNPPASRGDNQLLFPSHTCPPGTSIGFSLFLHSLQSLQALAGRLRPFPFPSYKGEVSRSDHVGSIPPLLIRSPLAPL